MILEFKGLSYGYERKLFNNISGFIKSGQILNVLGVNGVGKTTFAKCLLNIIKNYNGVVMYDSIDSKSLSVKERAKRIGYIGNGDNVSIHLNVFDYVLLGCAPELGLFRMPQRKDSERVMRILYSMGYAHIISKEMWQLSQGEKQLVSVFRILVQNPDIIIFDEPTASLDLGNQKRLLQLMKTLSNAGHIIINITHNPNQAFALGGHVILFSKNNHKFGEVNEIMTEANLSDLYEVNVKIIEDKDIGKIVISI